MKAKLAAELPDGEEWLYELKFDGFRFLGAKRGKEVRLWSRTNHDLTGRFPGVANALRALRADSFLVDGELVVADAKGRPSFQLIQNADESTLVHAYLFDVLEIAGDDLRRTPLNNRRDRLEELLTPHPALLLFSGELKGDPEDLLSAIAERELEGIIAKRRDSFYEAGQRSGAWLKVKCLHEQELVIGGFTQPKGARSRFGSLILGYFRGKELIFAGKVGTGFSEKVLREVHRKMTELRISESPFKELPRGARRWGTAFTAAEIARCTWIEPKLVAQVRFTEWTQDGLLRHPAFLGLREDKRAKDVVREE